MRKYKNTLRKIQLAFLAALFVALQPAILQAFSLRSKVENGIPYVETGTQCPSVAAGNTSIESGNNVDYAGNPVWTEAELELIAKHQPVYEQAAQEADVPWQMLAVIHKRESNLSLQYNSNQQGIYQFYEQAGDFPGSGTATQEEFLAQTKTLARQLQNDYVERNHSANKGPLAAAGTPDNVIQDTFFSYNGRASVYAQQARKLGFPTPEQAFQGSPYVMNKADAERDPNKNPNGWGQVKTDGGSIQYPANQDYGAWVYYAAIAGVGGCGATGETFTMDIDGFTYGWPVAPARQSENGGVPGTSALPCNSNSCHHDGTPAFDISRKPGEDAAVGTPVFAIVSGRIENRRDTYQGRAGCQTIQLVGEDGYWYWYGHVQGIEKANGDEVTAGEQIAIIGQRKCTGNGSLPHLHIDRGSPKGHPGGSVGSRDAGMLNIINTLFNNMPE